MIFVAADAASCEADTIGQVSGPGSSYSRTVLLVTDDGMAQPGPVSAGLARAAGWVPEFLRATGALP